MIKRFRLTPTKKKVLDILPIIIAASAVISVLVAGYMYVNIRTQADSIRQFELKSDQSDEAATQFEKGSDTLTYNAKAFCETTDMSYFRAYAAELTETRSRDSALQSMFRMNLTPREISRIQDAKIASDDLSNRELWAMELVALSCGVTEDEFPCGIPQNILTDEEKNLTPEEQYARGYKYIMSSSYFILKNKIDTGVQAFSSDLMYRYGDATIKISELGRSTALTSLIIIAVLVLFTVGLAMLYSRYEKENTLELSAAMENARSASRAKSDFLSSMSHDIRTPMNAIVGMTNMAQLSLAECQYDKASADLKVVQSSSRQLLSLINDVLDLSKIESGKMVLAKEPYSLPDAVNQAMEIILPLFIAKSQNYNVRIKKLRHEFVVGDQVRLKQVLVNILNNANKYTPAGGQVNFTVEELPSAAPETAMVRFIIADTGIGIAKEKLESIFEPFTREVNTSVNQVEGTGLGLTIVKSIVDAAGGTIKVSSVKEKGAEFTVTLPLRIQGEAEALERYSYLRGKKMLVIEQSDGYAAEVSEMLRQAGAESVCTSSLEEAIRAAADSSEVYLVALIDRSEGAAEAVRAIRSAAPKQAIILLVCDGKLKELEQTALAAGADGVLEKPLFRSALYEKIISVCQGKKAGVASDKYLLGRRILVVDDVEINRMIAQMMLESAGAQVERAGNGREAVEKFARSEPAYYDAILMDVMMPVMGGYEATRAIRCMARADAAQIPIIAMTANAFAEDVEKSHAAGMNGHINKPVEAGDVKAVLNGLL